MKNFYALCALALMMSCFSVSTMNAQECRNCHLLITDDGTGGIQGNDCFDFYENGDGLPLLVRAQSLVQDPHLGDFYDVSPICPPFRVKVSYQVNNHVLGVSDVLNNFSLCDDTPTGCGDMYCKNIAIPLDFSVICNNYLDSNSEPTSIPVQYEIVTANADASGNYSNYYHYSSTHSACFTAMFNSGCFLHEHDTDEGVASSHICVSCLGVGGNSNLYGEISDEVTKTSMEQFPSNEIVVAGGNQVYPNPFTNSLSLDYQVPNNSKIQVAVYNVKGQKLIDQTFLTQRSPLSIDTKGLNPGIYYCRVWNGDEFQTFKVMKAYK